MKRIILTIKKRIFSSASSYDLAKASAVGLFLGMQPVSGIRTILAVLISFLFQFNLLAVLFGIMITIMFPAINVFPLWLGNAIGLDHKHFYFFNPQMLSFQTLLTWTSREQYFFVVNLFGGLLCALISMFFFKVFYNSTVGARRSGHLVNFIFFDQTGKKRSNFVKIILSMVCFFMIIMFAFGLSINLNPYLPAIGLKENNTLSHISYYSVGNHSKVSANMLKKLGLDEKTYQVGYDKHDKSQKQPSSSRTVFAFYVSWDENSLASLKQNIRSINVAVPDWYTIDNNLNIKNSSNANVDSLIQVYGVNNMPLISNYINNGWDTDALSKLVNSKELTQTFITNLVQDLVKHHYYGINLDFESLKEADAKAYDQFVEQLSTELKKNNLKLSIDVPTDDNVYDDQTLSKYADYMVAMMYDEHEESSDAGPIASQGWFESNLSKMHIPSDKLIVSMGSYAYDWNLDSTDQADSLTFSDCMDLVDQNKLSISWDEKSGNAYMTYEDSGDKHIVWLLDAATFYNEVNYSTTQEAKGIALWRLGSEDMSLWHVVSDYEKGHMNSGSVLSVDNPTSVNYIGQGEVLKILSSEHTGARSIKLSNTGMIQSEEYTSYPSPFLIERFGKPKTKEIALTFDDGPSAEYTPQILDILKKNNIKATFFVVGDCGEKNPDLVEREYQEGHEIGNHTFTHPNVASTSILQTKFEMNATQRLIQEITGHSTILFRPPYVADAEPSTPDEILPVIRAENEGYLMIGELIDPSDWERPSSDVIVQRVLSQLSNGNVILLHDAGGNRENTVKALPVIISDLKAKGYKFVQIHDLLHVQKSVLMPAVSATDNPFMDYDTTMYDIMYLWGNIVQLIFYAAIVIGIFRLLFLIFFSYKQKQKAEEELTDVNFTPFVSVVIAAYNEEKVIVRTIDSILKSTYQNFEIIIVNDGSKDHTSGAVQEAFGQDARIRLIEKENGGKASAVNRGFREAKGEYVVCMDADTIISDDAIALLIRQFIKPNVAAVSGNIRVGNVHNIFTLWQHVEYVTGFNLERRAFAYLNAITVVPGAIGAWRKSAVEEVGYYAEDTLAEDTDITLSLLRKGYSIVFEEHAYAYTEAPGTLKSLVKQRYRWAYGTLQCLYKHRDALFNTEHITLGFLALPNMWLFQYFFQTISPLADIYFVIGLFGKSPLKIMAFYVAFLIMDYVTALYAFHLEKVNPKPLIGLVIQRILYRQIMSFVVIKSICSAIAGIAVGWNKLKREGNVNVANKGK